MSERLKQVARHTSARHITQWWKHACIKVLHLLLQQLLNVTALYTVGELSWQQHSSIILYKLTICFCPSAERNVFSSLCCVFQPISIGLQIVSKGKLSPSVYQKKDNLLSIHSMLDQSQLVTFHPLCYIWSLSLICAASRLRSRPELQGQERQVWRVRWGQLVV